jgi:hypothetical protein
MRQNSSLIASPLSRCVPRGLTQPNGHPCLAWDSKLSMPQPALSIPWVQGYSSSPSCVTARLYCFRRPVRINQRVTSRNVRCVEVTVCQSLVPSCANSASLLCCLQSITTCCAVWEGNPHSGEIPGTLWHVNLFCTNLYYKGAFNLLHRYRKCYIRVKFRERS